MRRSWDGDIQRKTIGRNGACVTLVLVVMLPPQGEGEHGLFHRDVERVAMGGWVQVVPFDEFKLQGAHSTQVA